MQVGISLKLQEAWKRKFESRPATAAIPIAPPSKPLGKDADGDILGDGSSEDGQPFFKQLHKKIASQNVPVPLINPLLGYRDECITVDARQTRKGQYVLVKGAEAFEAKQDLKKLRKGDSLLDPYCIVITRRFNAEGMLQDILTEIQSPQLVTAVRDVVSYYPDNSFRVGETIKCEDPPKLIYYHRRELAEYQSRPETDERTKTHIGFLLNYLYSHIGKAIEQYEGFLKAGMVKFGHLWMMFKPGCLVYERETEQLFYLESNDYRQTQCGVEYALNCQYVDYNGEKIGKVKHTIAIRAFGNPRQIDTLSVIPLDFHPAVDDLKANLTARAKRFLQLRGIHAMQHASKGRVMIDAKTFLRRALPGDEDKADSRKQGIVITDECKCLCAVCCKEVDEKPEDYDHEVREISDEEMLLCSSTVLGFALTSHKWIQTKIDDISDIQWSTDAIERLVLDGKQKKVLSSLISSPVFTEGIEGDVIGWKGKGLVMLLHGAPGTGKTLTAESICESLKRPLYIVSGGELGSYAQAVEQSLQEILELSKLWQAVILIDEADVFLEKRSANDIVRNNFVSVFLRRLEYFEGILMLTTNRVEQFDEAFFSRIHLSLAYPELEPWMRKAIWANVLNTLPAEQTDVNVETDLDEISKISLNGRVISYAVRTARAIAEQDGVKLTIDHLSDVVSVQQKFNDQLRQKRWGSGGGAITNELK